MGYLLVLDVPAYSTDIEATLDGSEIRKSAMPRVC